MSITYHERPGVYVEYDTTSYALSSAPRILGVAGLASGSGLYRFYSSAAAAQTFSTSTKLGKMLQLAFASGAAQVVCCPVASSSASAYAAAVIQLLSEGNIGCLAVDAENTQILAAIAALLCNEGAKECVAFAGLSEPTVSGLCSLAQSLNCERLVLLGADVKYAGENSYGGGCLAASAMAGLYSAQSDPALPLHGAQLPGLEYVNLSLTEAQIDTLVHAGVTPIEAVGGQVRIIRAVTTRTATDGVADATWRELTTVSIVDDVIPAVRDALHAKFLRRKNTAVTRNAIRSQAAIVLDDRVRREIIEGYENLTVEALENDPTTCEVSFTFRVVYGLCRIHLRIHILV